MNTLYNYRLTVQYDGTRYLGWQKLGQPGSEQYGRTIQGKLEAIFAKMTGEAVEVNGSGRTDAGVHAIGQVANFKTHFQTTAEEVLRYVNQYLPEDIAVTEVREAPERFHARLNAKAKIYRYTIRNSAAPDPFRQRFEYRYEGALDEVAMKEAAILLCGTHDFRNFCSSRRTKKSTVRTVYSIDVERHGDRLDLTFRGNGFLYNMVRILVGTLIEVGRSERSPEDIPGLFEAEARAEVGYTAPAKGLTLLEVEY